MKACDDCIESKSWNRWGGEDLMLGGVCDVCEQSKTCREVVFDFGSVSKTIEGDWIGTTPLGCPDADRGWPTRDYVVRCRKCECSFSGHKRQHVCRVCEEDNTKAQLALAQTELNKYKGLDSDGKMVLSPDAAETAKNLALIWDLTDALKGIRDLIRMDFMEEIDGVWRYVDDPDVIWSQIRIIEETCTQALDFRNKIAEQAKTTQPVHSDLRAAFDDMQRRVSALEGKTSGFFDIKGG